MAWYLNHYHCDSCDTEWEDDWSCCCDDDCPASGSRHWSPHESEDLTEVIEQDGDEFVVLVSPETAEHYPEYKAVARFPSEAAAHRFVVDGELT
ncbi:hypothetical protein [Devosia insulae]|uniref:hypothetical protein n=1 Tax=Devosia insulae TaxID=408174 RepID=UPI000854B689|nr:hypothetical protein [Devosia insulae]